MILYINGNYPYHSLHSELVYKIAEMGNEITVFVPIKGTECEGIYSINHPNVKIVYSDCLKTIDKILFLNKINRIARCVEDAVDLTKVDCILAGTVYSDGLVAFLLHRKYRIPFSFAVRQTDVTYQMRWRPYLNGHIRKMVSDATYIIFLSHAYKRYIDKFEADQNKYVVIPNAVNDYWFKNARQKRSIHDPVSLIYVGEIDKNKNINTTIETVALLQKKGISAEFHIIGSGPEEEKCKMLAEKLGIDDRVIFHGWQAEKEAIKDFYDQSDIFVMLSHKETFGTVYIEALSQGLPIIYTKNQGIDGYFKEGSVGYACNPTKVQEIAQKIKEIIDNYAAISDECLNQSNRFTWEMVAKKYNEVLQKCMGEK